MTLTSRRLALSLLATVFLTTVLAPVAGHAEVLVAQSRTTPITFGGAAYLVDFNGAAAGGTQFGFSTTAPNQIVAFIFNAECAVDGGPNLWVNIDLQVDPAGAVGWTTVAPTNGDNAFCSGNSTTTGIGDLDGWVSAATVAYYSFPVPGLHQVRVRVDGASGPLSRLDDLSLVVMR
jgi:hypothetical protein